MNLNQEQKDQGIEIPIGKKLYDERDYPTSTKVISEDKDNGII